MIDFHSHVLPGVDDGSQSLEQTDAMLKRSYDQGVRYMVATPHFYADEMIPETFLANRQYAYESICDRNKNTPQLILGAEVAYFNNISCSEAVQQLQIGQTRLLLVEMPFSSWSERVVEDVCRLQDRQGLTPVLAHVERYRDRSQVPLYRDRLLAQGVLFQSNAEGLLKRNTRSWLLKQLKAGCIHFLGTDCHNLTSRAPNLAEAAALICKKAGQDILDEIWDFSAQILSL